MSKGSSSRTSRMKTETIKLESCFLNPTLHFASHLPNPSRDPKVSTDVSPPILPLPVVPVATVAWIFFSNGLQSPLCAFVPMILIVLLCCICPPNLHLNCAFSFHPHSKQGLQPDYTLLSNCNGNIIVLKKCLYTRNIYFMQVQSNQIMCTYPILAFWALSEGVSVHALVSPRPSFVLLLNLVDCMLTTPC